MKISKNFDLEEFTTSQIAKKLNIDNTPPKSAEYALCSLVSNIIQPLRDRFGRPFRINSGFRSPALNQAVGGVPTSQHLKGEAADIATNDPHKLAKLARDLNFDQMILYPNFVHFSYKYSGRQRNQVIYNKAYKGLKDL